MTTLKLDFPRPDYYHVIDAGAQAYYATITSRYPFGRFDLAPVRPRYFHRFFCTIDGGQTWEELSMRRTAGSLVRSFFSYWPPEVVANMRIEDELLTIEALDESYEHSPPVRCTVHRAQYLPDRRRWELKFLYRGDPIECWKRLGPRINVATPSPEEVQRVFGVR